MKKQQLSKYLPMDKIHETNTLMTRQEEYQIKKAEKSRLLSQIKALEKKRTTLTDPTEQEQAKAQIRELRAQHDAVHQQVEELKRWLQWNACAGREIACAGDE